MELYKEILTGFLEKQTICVTFPDLHMDPAQIITIESYKALEKIKAIMNDDSLEDKTCFMKIEEIVCLFERLGSDGGSRHDF